MSPIEVTTILRQFNERCRDCQFEDQYRVMEGIDAAIEMIERAEQETAAQRAKVERMTQRLRMILEEPKESMSDSKALREMVRQARLALEESK